MPDITKLPDIIRIYEFIDKINSIEVYEELEALYGELVKSLGFNYWACLKVSSGQKSIRDPLRNSFGNIPDNWYQHYSENNFIYNDYAAAKVLDLEGPFWWNDITDNIPLEKRQIRVFEEAKSFDLRNGLAIPLIFADGSVWSCLMTTPEINLNQELTNAIAFAAQFYARRGMYLKNRPEIPDKSFNPIYKNAPKKDYKLTKRQRQIVELLKKGNTQQECANILQISHSTVFNQTNEAKERLNCKTIAHLVATAMESGEIK